jgi:hypothetical protein
VILLWLALSCWSAEKLPMEAWATGIEIADRHSTFRNSELLLEPAGTWQTIFGVILPGHKIAEYWRHCVHVKLPRNREAGIIRVTAQGMEESCQGQWDENILWETQDVRQVQFSLEGKEIRLWWDDGRPHAFRTRLQEMSGVFLLSPEVTTGKWPAPPPLLADETPCKFEDGTCQRCRRGVVRIVGTKPSYLCGVDRCGEKDRPACPRGTRWQRTRGPFTCRGENSHVFCNEGLKVECLGDQAFCR